MDSSIGSFLYARIYARNLKKIYPWLAHFTFILHPKDRTCVWDFDEIITSVHIKIVFL